jgi:hypothetical protein
MIGIGKKFPIGHFEARYWKSGEMAMNNEVVLERNIAPVVGYDPEWEDGYYLLTSDQIRHYRIGNLINSKDHPLEISVSDVDWFYHLGNDQRFLLAYNGEISFYDMLTFQLKDRQAIPYDKLHHLWGNIVLLQDKNGIKVLNVMTEEVILSWAQSSIEWFSDDERAGVLLADGSVVIFSKIDYQSFEFTFPPEIDRFSVKGIFPFSNKDLFFSTVGEGKTKLFHFDSENSTNRELDSWDFQIFGYHTGWTLDDKTSFLLNYVQKEIEFETDHSFSLHEKE